ncbi:MAG: hypothetical protein ABIC91_05660 [Nanoarchaeota archaeon]|nr:hypothetical protein [Nanoarchaeota archaeon]MBU1030572.1 hypothetical protein [Nanoarchaeota archaeon]MBU1849376.1 hypothetical protein [Nanoarchaeota archaeon]
MTLSPEAIKKISEIKLTPIESIFEKKMLGLLYGNSKVLEYYNFETEERRILARANAAIWGVHHDSKTKKTYFDNGIGSVICLETGSKKERDNYNCIQSIKSFDNFILDTGGFGLFNTKTSKELLSKYNLNDNNIGDVESLNSFNNSLYAQVRNFDKSQSIVEVNTSNPNKFFIGETIKKCEVKAKGSRDFAIVPQGNMRGDNGRNYPFSIITCANISYLDLNGEKILGTEVNNSSDQSIHRVELIKSTPTTAEIIYSGKYLYVIYKADIDLTNKTAITKSVVENLSNCVLALQPIFNKSSHEHLSSIGSVIR